MRKITIQITTVVTDEMAAEPPPPMFEGLKDFVPGSRATVPLTPGDRAAGIVQMEVQITGNEEVTL